MLAKRLFDLFWSSLGLLILSPFFILTALWIKLDSRGPIFFRQERVGRHGVPFHIYKFRSMVVDAERHGGQLTVGADRRITRSGAFLRRTKLDELPQLINVALGQMSLVGPRPEVPRYVAHYPEAMKQIVLSVPPGITDHASVHFWNESELLAEAEDPEQFYIDEILPKKLALYKQYVESRTLAMDLGLILKTCLPFLNRSETP
uniref:Putative Sugar transferase n=1 Tax=Magnetococcus massalia (strain MO-1) TaxID=451514 RepID=A0A1S7LJ29_MAGMO|nr:putative Sugar transferase [Candidatus Magnetococcus massalia]